MTLSVGGVSLDKGQRAKSYVEASSIPFDAQHIRAYHLHGDLS